MQITQITFTRFIAALGVIGFHFGRNLDISVFNYGNLGVSYFFLLSGFIMIIAYSDTTKKIDCKSYEIKRFARIYPVYFIALILQIVFASTSNFLQIFCSLFLVQSWFRGYALSINTAGWSISVEMFFYILFPFLFNFFYRKVSLKKLAIYIISFWLFSQIILYLFFNVSFFHIIADKGHDLNYYPLTHLNQFLIGNLAGLYFLKNQKTLNNRKTKFYLVLCIIISLIVINVILDNNINILHNGFMAIFYVPVILYLSIDNGFVKRIFSQKYLVYLGEISYSIYILQFPVYLFCSYFIKIDSLSLLCLYIAFLIIISIIVYEFIERPARRLIREKLIRTNS